MTCSEVMDRLNDAVDGDLTASEFAGLRSHLGSCPACRAEMAAVESLLSAAASAPKSIEPERDLWPGIESVIRGRAPRRAFPAFPGGMRLRNLAIAAMLAAVLAGAWYAARTPEPQWTTSILPPRASGGNESTKAPFRRGSLLATDGTTRAELLNGSVGVVEVEPNSRLTLVDAGPGEHRFALERGTIRASTWVPPRVFVIETPSAIAVDLGCEYRLVVDSSGRSLLLVTAGWVELAWKDREVIVPAAALCRTLPGRGPGTPCSEYASDSLKEALERYDFGGGTRADLDIVLGHATRHDAVTLWNLVSSVGSDDRPKVIDRLAALVPLPAGTTREGILSLDGIMLEEWWNAFEPMPLSGLRSQPSLWTRLWYDFRKLASL